MADLHAKSDEKNRRLHSITEGKNTEGKNTEGKNTVPCLECIFFFFFTFLNSVFIFIEVLNLYAFIKYCVIMWLKFYCFCYPYCNETFLKHEQFEL